MGVDGRDALQLKLRRPLEWFQSHLPRREAFSSSRFSRRLRGVA